jgi:hypothetical protein
MIDIYPYYLQVVAQYYAVRVILALLIVSGWHEWTVWLFLLSTIPYLEPAVNFMKRRYITILPVWIFYWNNLYLCVAQIVMSTIYYVNTSRLFDIIHIAYSIISVIAVCQYSAQFSIFMILRLPFVIIDTLIKNRTIHNWWIHVINESHIELWVIVAAVVGMSTRSLTLVCLFELAILAVADSHACFNKYDHVFVSKHDLLTRRMITFGNNQYYVWGKRQSILAPSYIANDTEYWYNDNVREYSVVGRARVAQYYELHLNGFDLYLPIECAGTTYFQQHPLQNIIRSYL